MFFKVLCLCFFVSCLQGATHYIDPMIGDDLNGDGTISNPWKTLESVSSTGKLDSFVSSGDIVYLRNGYHGRPEISSSYNDIVTIKAEEGHEDVKLAFLALRNARNITFEGFKVSPFYCNNCYHAYESGASIILGRGNNVNITLQNLEVFSYPWSIANSWETEADLKKRSNGIRFKHDNFNITVKNCNVYLVDWGIVIDSQNPHVEGNWLDLFGPGDAFQFAGDGTLKVIGNYCTNVVRYPTDTAHCDLIQVVNAPFDSVRIFGNQFYQYNADHPFPNFKGVAQGFFGCSECSDCIIESNILANSHHHGITFCKDSANTKVINNTVVNLGDLGSSPIKQYGVGSIVANNFAFAYDAVNAANNITLTQSNLNTYFIDPANHDYRLKQNSPGIDSGVNSYVNTTMDSFGNQRIYNNTVDIGAHEFGSSNTTDVEEPTLSNISAVDIGFDRAIITWLTNEGASSMVDYGTTDNYGQTATTNGLTTGHSVVITGLQNSTTYHYRVRSADASGNEATSVDFTFTTSDNNYSPSEKYVRDGASGDGSDWSNALGDLPASLDRGTVYWVADGSYNSYVFDDPTNGGNYITIRKASAANHGTEVGWLASYGDGVAEFGPLVLNSDYINIEGTYEYGIKVIGDFESVVVRVDSNYANISYVELDGNFTIDSNGNQIDGACNGMNIEGNYVTVENCDIHNMADDGIGIYGDNIMIIGNRVHNLHGCGTDNGCGPCFNGHSDALELNDTKNVEIKNNLIYDIQSTSAFFPGNWNPNSYVENLTLENNVFYTPDTGLCVYLQYIKGAKVFNNVIWGRTQGNRYGGLAIGPELTDLQMYNNIILNINFTHLGGTFDPLEHDMDYNHFGMVNTGEYTVNANDIVGNPLFNQILMSQDSLDHPKDITIEDFSLSELSASINSGYLGDGAIIIPNLDILGNNRFEDGSPDRGIVEMGSTSIDLTPPILSAITASDLTSNTAVISWLTNENATSVVNYGTTENYGQTATAFGYNTNHSILITDLQSDETYHFIVKSVDASGNEAISGDFTLTTLSNPNGDDLNAGLIGYWSFDEGSGNVVKDVSSNGLDGVVSNDNNWTLGKIDDALSFSSGNYVNLGEFDVTGDKLTITAWIKPDRIGTDPRIISKATGTSAGDIYWMLEVDNGGIHQLGFRLNSGGSYDRLTGGVVDEPYQWIHIVGVYDGTTMRLYQDGVEVASMPKTGNLRVGNAPVWVGDNPSSTIGERPFQGIIDEVRVYNRALSLEEIVALRDTTLPTSPTGLQIIVP